MLAISDHGDVNDFAEVVFLKGECVNRIKDMTEYENFNEIEWKRKMETSFLETHKGTLMRFVILLHSISLKLFVLCHVLISITD